MSLHSLAGVFGGGVAYILRDGFFVHTDGVILTDLYKFGKLGRGEFHRGAHKLQGNFGGQILVCLLCGGNDTGLFGGELGVGVGGTYLYGGGALEHRNGVFQSGICTGGVNFDPTNSI